MASAFYHEGFATSTEWSRLDNLPQGLPVCNVSAAAEAELEAAQHDRSSHNVTARGKLTLWPGICSQFMKLNSRAHLVRVGVS
jgi:hypothetical protein